MADLEPGAIAVIGIGCRFPGGANTPQQFWDLLCHGVDAITELPHDRFDLDAVFDPDPDASGRIYARWGGFVDALDGFDADFFGIAPREAQHIDPQQRLLLEVVWEALEDGGLVLDHLAKTRTGVFVGISSHDYGDIQLRPSNRVFIDTHSNPGSAASIAANRISYVFDLRGPSLAVDTACSSSLTALHLACRSISSGECSLAIVAGVNAILTPEPTVGFCKASMLSPDGRCKSFDARADGYVRSEGAGAVVLKPIGRALEEGDPIYAVVRGTAINQDGHTTGITVPSAAAQEEGLQEALRQANLPASAVQYVEAHGTGTPVGDPIEAAAIGAVFGRERAEDDRCIMGSVKTNIGHLEAAAGIAGLIKAALALKYRAIPPNLHFHEPNGLIPFDALRLRVPTVMEPWPPTNGPATAAVNSFGFGGANAHAILQERPAQQIEASPLDDGATHLLTISARSPGALRKRAEQYRDLIRSDEQVALRDLCHTAAARRAHLEYRLALVGDSGKVLAERLESYLEGEHNPNLVVGRRAREEPKIAFLFTGMGPQWWGVGRQLMRSEPRFLRVLEECDRRLRPLSEWSLLDELAADVGESRVAQPYLVHVANFALQVALADLWRSWGIIPDAVVGHSSGEMAAACVAGALDLTDALLLSFHRGRLQHRTSGSGRMLAAGIAPDSIPMLIAGDEARVSLAAVNSPTSVTLSGSTDVLDRIAATLKDQGVFCRYLPVSVPYHGPQMDAIREEFLAAVGGLRPHNGAIPLLSAVTGGWYHGGELDGGYWWRNIRHPVRFAQAIDTLIESGFDTFVEVGPHPVLASSVAECLASRERSGTVLPTLRRQGDERAEMLRSLAALHIHGHPVRWSGLYPRGRCVRLPPYPWQRERHWLKELADDPAVTSRPPGRDTNHPLLGMRLPSPHPTWEADLADSRLAFLNDHAIQGRAIYPGAAYLEAALSVGHELWQAASGGLERMAFHKLLFLHSPHARVMQIHYQPATSIIELYSGGGGDDTTWTLHASGRLTAEKVSTPPRVDLSSAREQCRTEIPFNQYYGALGRSGYQFGETFRRIVALWVGEREAVARIELPPGTPYDPYLVHPALLDAAFQTLSVAAGSLAQGGAHVLSPLVPISIRRVTTYRPARGPLWVLVSARASTGTTAQGDVSLVDDHGEMIVRLEGIELRALDEPGESRDAHIDDSLFQTRWTEAPLPGGVGPAPEQLPSPSEVRTMVAPSIPRLCDERERERYYRFVEPVLNAVAVHAIREALDALTSDMDLRTLSADEGAKHLSIAPAHHRFFARLIEILKTKTSDRMLSQLGADRRMSTKQLTAALAGEHPEYRAELALLAQSWSHLPALLRGELDAREILLTEESISLLAALYSTSPTLAFYNDLVSEAAGALSQARSSGRLNVLEVGAGTGATTSALLRKLPPDSTEYCFTDVSPFFLHRARARFGEWPQLRRETLDIERDPASQEFAPHSFELVVATNVLHATADLRGALQNVLRLLVPGGLLLLSEATRRSAWLDLIFGPFDGWWRFTDFHLRPSHPLLSAGAWKSVLEEIGFDDVVTMADRPRHGGTQASVFLAGAPVVTEGATARSPESPLRRSWVILADQQGVSDRLMAALRMRGDICTAVYAGQTYRQTALHAFQISPLRGEDLGRLLSDVAASGLGITGVIHAWSLDAPTAGISSDSLMDWQQIACGSVLDLIQATEPNVEIWLITSGAQPVTGADEVSICQSPLWGLGRVLMTEYPTRRCRLIDLSCPQSSADVEALLEELQMKDVEQEVAFRRGRRFVREVTRITLPPVVEAVREELRSPHNSPLAVQVGTPGALDSIHLAAVPSPKPGPGEVVLSVVASGLNFRSILLAMGMYPSERPDENDPSATLGLEHAGVVLECGEGVESLRPGDEVIAIGEGGLASRVVTRAELTVPKPPNLTFEESAGIPSAFLTASYALHNLARLQTGERVLIHAAAGAVGLAAIRLARRIGAEIFATAGTPEKRAFLTSLGIDHVMDSRSLAFANEVLEATGGEGVDVVLNSLGGEAIRKGLEVLRPYGRFVEIGKRDIHSDARIGLSPFRKNIAFFALDLLALARDRPALVGSMLKDLVRQVSGGALELLPHSTFDLSQAEEAFRFMAQARHIGKIVLTMQEATYTVRVDPDRRLFRSDGTYLITGGLGGFGLVVASWMAQHGAGSVILTGRSGLPKEDGPALTALRTSPANVLFVKSDVSRVEDVQSLLDLIHEELPPLRGIIHAAMLLDDDLLLRLDRERLQAVLAPKVAGAWNLHTLTLEEKLDFFVLFSSATSLFGHQSQGSYSAANAFLDSLAPFRQGLDLPALTINWGPIIDAGYVSRHEGIAQYLAWGGLAGFRAEEALKILGALLRHDLGHVMAARVDWQMWSQRIRATMDSGPFERFAAAEAMPDIRAEGEETLLPALRNATGDMRGAILEEHIARRVAKVAGMAAEKIDPDRPLTEMGFDSLMTVELQTALKLDFGMQLSIVQLLEGATLRELSDLVWEQVIAESPLSLRSEPTQLPFRAETPSRAFPLSFEQQRFWYLDQLHPRNPAGNLYAAYRLVGDLEKDVLERSLTELVRRHSLLRATITAEEGEPVQLIAAPTAVALPVVDLRPIAAPEREEEARRLATIEVRRPFDLQHGPLYRFCLLRLEEQEHVFIGAWHHSVFDAPSSAIFLREGLILYEAFRRGEPSPLPELGITYLDYVRRQWETSRDVSMERQLAYWREQLAGARPRLRLPTDRPIPVTRSLVGGRRSFTFSQKLSDAVIALSRQEGVTLFMTLLAAYGAVLQRYSGEEDITVGTPLVTRTHPGTETLIGCFLNTLALRLDLSGDPTFRELLQRVQGVAVGAYSHADVPFERVVGAVQPERGPASMPLFQTMLVVHSVPMPDMNVPGLTLSPLEVDSGTALYDLMLLIEPEETLRGSLEYSLDLFDTDAAARILEHFEALLAGAVANPDAPLSAIPLLGDSERRIAQKWTATVEDGPSLCLHQMVEAQVKRTPDAVAVVDGERELTYAKLNRDASELAQSLRSIGVGPDVVVGVFLDRSIQLVTALLAVLKAGGAFLPLDPASPRARIAFMLTDAHAPIVVTQRRLAGQLSGFEGTVFEIERDIVTVERDVAVSPPGTLSPDDLAYVLYTSGSTGEPKGVMVTQRGICNQVKWRQQAFPLDERDAVVQRTPIGFDPSIWEFFGPLCTGSRVVLAEPGSDRDPAQLLRCIVNQNVTVLQVVPSLLDVLVQDPGFESCRSLRHVFCGGEPLGFALQQRFFAACAASLHHMYGPTEASIDATFWTCRPGMDPMVPIGQSIEHVQVYVLDTRLRPTLTGVVGELYVGGAGVARGYLNHPQLTAERFIPNPFSQDPAARLYRTGDLGRCRSDGAIEFVGRADAQIKLRGVRVEPAEIEGVLARFPMVRQAAVGAGEDGWGNPQLIAYLVVDPTWIPDIAELRSLVREWLPQAMQPSRYVLLEALPLLPNGKLDRLALERSAGTEVDSRASKVEPRDPTELQLVEIWEVLFDHRPIGVTDDFFELGGHSLLAMRLAARLTKVFGLELPPGALFENTTIERLARLIREGAVPRLASSIVTLASGGSGAPFFCIHPLGGDTYCYAELSQRIGGDRPVFGLRALGLIGEEEPLDTIEAMANSFIEAIREVQSAGPYYLGGWSMGGIVALEMAHRLRADGDEVAELALIDAWPANAAQGTDTDDWSALLDAFLRSLGLSLEILTGSLRSFPQLDSEGQLTYALACARDAGLVSNDEDLVHFRRRLRVCIAHLLAMQRHVPRPYAGRMVLFMASEPAAGPRLSLPPQWNVPSSGGVEVVEIPGNHYSILRLPHVEELARALKVRLDRASVPA